MRSTFLSSLGAILSLGVLGAFTSVTCDPKHHPGVNGTHAPVPSTDALAQVTTHCVQSICSTTGTDATSTEHCGPLVITITQLSTFQLDVANCVDRIHRIFYQCIATEGVPGGISQTHDVLYEVSVTNGNSPSNVEELDARSKKNESSDDDAEEDQGLEDDSTERQTMEYKEQSLGRQTNDGSENDANRALEGRGQERNRKKKAKKNRANAKLTNRPKPTPKSNQNGKLKACPPPNNKKGGALETPGPIPTPRKKIGSKNVRGVGEKAQYKGLLQRGNGQSAGRKRPNAWERPRPKKPGQGGSGGDGRKPTPQPQPQSPKPEPKGCEQEEFYKKTILSQDEATWWSFRTKPGWKNQFQANSGEKTVLDKMEADGRFDVIKIKYGYLEVMGRQTGGTIPSTFEKERGEPYLLSNVGQTFRRKDPLNSKEKNGDIGGQVSRGDERRKRPNWLEVSPTQVKKNERLGLVEMQNGDYYLFVYTANSRNNGKNIEEFRDLIMIWFASRFIDGIFSPRDIKQATNLDGGRSIYVSWNDGSGGEPVRIAKGEIHDETPTSSGVKVANLIKISPGIQIEG
ncbi:hypothetical protein BS50DRAFT_628914 [Corynespora cassiicola Philippines]|uniref:Uncharacterized protein n=1 Tax=Corynespora cassiicola Philippines TaxID=1448308 RepID=A0A2T2P539_CORCC|nr:hypothetical protein BS50DRAFT_628914 [Corynespora cassiicola Philippines]